MTKLLLTFAVLATLLCFTQATFSADHIMGHSPTVHAPLVLEDTQFDFWVNAFWMVAGRLTYYLVFPIAYFNCAVTGVITFPEMSANVVVEMCMWGMKEEFLKNWDR